LPKGGEDRKKRFPSFTKRGEGRFEELQTVTDIRLFRG